MQVQFPHLMISTLTTGCQWLGQTLKMSRFRISCHSKYTYSNLCDVINQRHKQTDRQTDRGHYSAPHGKMYVNTVT